MNAEKLQRLLKSLASIKKTLSVTPESIGIWAAAMREVDDDVGVEAFAELVRMPIPGDWLPSHALEAVRAVEVRRSSAAVGKYPKISEARPFWGTVDLDNPAPEYAEWLRIEREKLYRARTHDGKVALVKNPACWGWFDSDGRKVFVREKPQLTGATWTEDGEAPKPEKRRTYSREAAHAF